MAKPDPRANQKQRTRAAIVEAASRMIRDGKAPTVAEAAEAAKVSRATAYRYFPTPEALHTEVVGITPAFEPVERLVASLQGDDAPARLARFLAALNGTSFAEEARVRMALRVYLDTWFGAQGGGAEAPPVREGRRMRWLEQVLAPVLPRLSAAERRRLEAALALTCGGDAMVVMRDVCHLEAPEALDVLQWAAQALLRAALDEAGSGKEPVPPG